MEIHKGDWVLAKKGCIGLGYGRMVVVTEPDETGFVEIRYKARRCSDNAIIWVHNGCNVSQLERVRGSTRLSIRVTKMIGPYGLGFEGVRRESLISNADLTGCLDPG